MQTTIVEDKKNLLILDIEGVSHELCLGLKDVLSADKDVTTVTYKMEHPLIRKARFYLDAKDAKKLFTKAVSDIQKENKKILTLVEKAK